MKKFLVFLFVLMIFFVPHSSFGQSEEETPEIKQYIEETNKLLDYYRETGQTDRTEPVTSLHEIYEDVHPDHEISYEDYRAMIQESMVLDKLSDLPESEKTYAVDLDFNSGIKSPRMSRLANGISHNFVYTGDIIVTNTKKFYGGAVGHAGFVTTDNTIISMGPNVGVYIDSLKAWQDVARKDGGYIQILRPKNKAESVHRHNAKAYVLKHYTINGRANPNITYKITSNLPSTNPSYCSKIPFQAYKFGAGVGKDLPSENTIIHPLRLPGYFRDNPNSLFTHSEKVYY